MFVAATKQITSFLLSLVVLDLATCVKPLKFFFLCDGLFCTFEQTKSKKLSSD